MNSLNLSASATEPCFSIRLLRPFWAPLLKTPIGTTSLMKELVQMPDEARIPVREVLRWLDLLVQLTGDPDIGLRATLRVDSSTGDVLTFAARSAATFEQAINLVLRYVRILNEAAEYSIVRRDQLVSVELHSRVPLSRQASDFQMGAFIAGTRAWLGHLDGFQVWFAHPAPRDLTLYQEVFGPAEVRFDAPIDAITFDVELLSAPLQNADQTLHKILVRHADELVNAIPEEGAVSPLVRKVLIELLPQGKGDATHVAAALGMSRRTMLRHLEREGLTYKELLEKTRHQAALQYLEKSNLDPQQIAFLLGYSVTAAFSRAFARWEGRTPTDHRRAHRQAK